MSGGAGPDLSLNGKFKVVLCTKFERNICDKGSQCNFAHGLEELDFYRTKQVPNYKRALCKSYEETGSCEWNQTCMFAHGSRELRMEAGPSGMGGGGGGGGDRFFLSDMSDNNKLARPSDSLFSEYPEPKRMRF